jgi:hypothetical protein
MENWIHWGCECIKPGYSPITDCLIVNDGEGQRIAYWNTETMGTKPSDESLIQSGQEYYAQVQAEQQVADAKKTQIVALTESLTAGTATSEQVQAALAYLIEKLIS